MRRLTEQVLLARAYLSRVAEPASIPVWRAVCERGPEQVAAEIRDGNAGSDIASAVGSRAELADPAMDLDIAERHGIRLVVPESADWPHFGMGDLERAGAHRAQTWADGKRAIADYGEPVPPLALWVRGNGDLASMGVRSVSIVGSRASTHYGNHVAGELAAGLARREFTVVSGGAFGIDSAAHRGALAVGGHTVIVSAGGLDRAYPLAHAALYERVAEQGLLVSESPPGSAPQRRRFLTRNRLIATFGSGTVVVEAATRSGAMNTAGHARRIGRPAMAVPGPVTSTMSAGCHQLLADVDSPAILVTGVDDVLAMIGALGEGELASPGRPPRGTPLQQALDELDAASRVVFDAMPARRTVQVDELARTAGLTVPAVLGALPDLEMRGLVIAEGAGHRLTGRHSRP